LEGAAKDKKKKKREKKEENKGGNGPSGLYSDPLLYVSTVSTWR